MGHGHRRVDQVKEGECRSIGTDAEEGSVAEGEQTRMAEKQIIAYAEDRIDNNLGHEVCLKVAHDQRKEDGQEKHKNHRSMFQVLSHSFFPKSPVGLAVKTMTMNR